MITEDAKDKFSASLLMPVAAKHVRQVFAGGCSIIFLTVRSVQLVIFFPIISLLKLTWCMSPSSSLRAFIRMSASQNVS